MNFTKTTYLNILTVEAEKGKKSEKIFKKKKILPRPGIEPGTLAEFVPVDSFTRVSATSFPIKKTISSANLFLHTQ